MLAGCLGGVEAAAHHVTMVHPTSVLVEKGSDQEGGGDSGKVQLGLELKDLMVANNRKGSVSENDDDNDVSPDEGGEVPGGDVG